MQVVAEGKKKRKEKRLTPDDRAERGERELIPSGAISTSFVFFVVAVCPFEARLWGKKSKK